MGKKWCRRLLNRCGTFGLLLLLFYASGRVWAGEVEVAQAEDPLQVGVSHLPPFAIRYDDGWDGIAVQLWQRVAEALELEYELIEVASEEALSLLADGSLDLVITAVATGEAESALDFTQSYFLTDIAFAETRDRTVVELLRAVFSPRFLRNALWVLIVLAVMGILMWWLEHQRNREEFGGGTGRGIWSGFWWAIVTLSTIGYGDKNPGTVKGQALAVIWILMVMVISASLTATIASVLTVGATTGTSFPEDLRGQQVGTLAETPGASFLETQLIEYETFETPEEGLRALRAGELEFFVHDAIVLTYLNNELFAGDLTVVPVRLQPRRFAFALPENSPLLEPFNQALLDITAGPTWQAFLNRFLSEG